MQHDKVYLPKSSTIVWTKKTGVESQPGGVPDYSGDKDRPHQTTIYYMNNISQTENMSTLVSPKCIGSVG